MLVETTITQPAAAAARAVASSPSGWASRWAAIGAIPNAAAGVPSHGTRVCVVDTSTSTRPRNSHSRHASTLRRSVCSSRAPEE